MPLASPYRFITIIIIWLNMCRIMFPNRASQTVLRAWLMRFYQKLLRFQSWSILCVLSLTSCFSLTFLAGRIFKICYVDLLRKFLFIFSLLLYPIVDRIWKFSLVLPFKDNRLWGLKCRLCIMYKNPWQLEIIEDGLKSHCQGNSSSY